MHIDEIQLLNLRRFGSFAIELDPQLTLLVGRNGAGKSTVLEGIAIALGAWLGSFTSIKEGFTIPRRSPRIVKSEVDGIAVEQQVFPVRVSARGAVMGRENVEWERELRSAGGRTSNADATHLRNLGQMTEAALALGGDSPISLPLLAYYGTGRLWLQKRNKKGLDGKSKSSKSRLNGYRSALESSSDHKGLESWMERLEKIRIQQLAQALDEGRALDSVATPLLDTLSETVCRCLENASRFYYTANQEELRLDFIDGTSLSFDRLSDGQRNIVALAADIAWRASQLNPHLGRKAPEQTEGVVLIDEVELHLHPAWQRRVLGDLVRAFPRIQFVVTTHSPQIMSSAPVGAIRFLDDPQVARPIDARGMTTDRILEDLMGVSARPEDVKERLLALGRMIELGEIEQAKRHLQDLSAGNPGPHDPAVVAARWELSMAETQDHEEG